MGLIFHTNNINKRFVRRVVENTLINIDEYPYDFLEIWEIHVWGLGDMDTRFFDHIKTTSGQKINKEMPAGVTGLFRMDLWLHDSTNDFKERENSDRIQHELCHARLINTPEFVHGVHSMVNIRFQTTFWYWNKWRYSRFTLSIIDIRQFL